MTIGQPVLVKALEALNLKEKKLLEENRLGIRIAKNFKLFFSEKRSFYYTQNV